MPVVLVTGLMRTGTSLVSRQLHRMGIPMGTTMRFPLPQANGQEDWEDIEFTDMMLNRLIGLDNSSEKDFLHRISAYELKRRTSSVWGVKSPFALPFVEHFKLAVEDKVKVVLTTRDVAQTYESLKSQNSNTDIYSIQDKLLRVLYDVKPDLTVKIEDSWSSPDAVKSRLEELIRS